MSIFTIGDLHLSFSADKPMTIFRGWDNYIERLEENWRALVAETDTVVLPGDLSWSLKLENTLADFQFVDRLPGKKLLLKGNHDLWWCTVTKMKNFLLENELHSIDFIHNNAFAVEGLALCGTRGWFFDDQQSDKKVLNREAMRLDTSIKEAKKTGLPPVVFLHYPPVYVGQVCEEIMQVLKESEIHRVYYGHIHGSGARGAVQGMFDGIDFRLVSCDTMGFAPLKVEA